MAIKIRGTRGRRHQTKQKGTETRKYLSGEDVGDHTNTVELDLDKKCTPTIHRIVKDDRPSERIGLEGCLLVPDHRLKAST